MKSSLSNNINEGPKIFQGHEVLPRQEGEANWQSKQVYGMRVSEGVALK